jgi:hypothetical protein
MVCLGALPAGATLRQLPLAEAWRRILESLPYTMQEEAVRDGLARLRQADAGGRKR